MSDLIEFLRARLVEDEAVAREADDDRWTYEYGEFRSRGGDDFEHILRHDPARVLADVKADRDLIAAYREAEAYYATRRQAPAGELHGLATALRIRAARFAAHPDYPKGQARTA